MRRAHPKLAAVLGAVLILVLPPAAFAADEGLPDLSSYERLMEAIRLQTAQDTLGNGAFGAGMQAYEAGRFDEAVQELGQFVQLHPRNLAVTEALETILLIRSNREFKDEPLRIYVAAEAARRAGHPDSAAALARSGLAKFPGAKIRDRWNFLLAELARDRGDHAAAIGFALTVADTAAASRLAPYALRMAAEETLALGTKPVEALRYYQDLLERYPNSPLAPDARSRVLELRKKFQL
jgi:TolA-binding protein